ncbi:NADP-dependent oxidoreductase, partial [Halorubrum sp. SD612]
GRGGVGGVMRNGSEGEGPTAPGKLPGLGPGRAKVRGLLVGDFATRFGEASERLADWVASGELEHRETVVEGLENAPDAFLGLFSGDNIGKQVVRVSAGEP